MVLNSLDSQLHSTLSATRREILMSRLHKKAKDLTLLYNRYNGEIPEHEKSTLRAWWLGAPDPNDFNRFTDWRNAFDEWAEQNANL